MGTFNYFKNIFITTTNPYIWLVNDMSMSVIFYRNPFCLKKSLNFYFNFPVFNPMRDVFCPLLCARCFPT